MRATFKQYSYEEKARIDLDGLGKTALSHLSVPSKVGWLYSKARELLGGCIPALHNPVATHPIWQPVISLEPVPLDDTAAKWCRTLLILGGKYVGAKLAAPLFKQITGQAM